MELLALGSAAATIASATRWLTSSGTGKQPVYTLTPPAFDRVRPESVLTSTPLETFQHARNRLYSAHYTSGAGGPGAGDRLLDVRLHMAPSRSESHDFMAHIYLPRAQPGQPTRPLAEARFHLQSPLDPNSFSNVVLRTEGGGGADWSGAFNLTAAVERMKQLPSKPTVGGETAPRTQTPAAPRGLSAFFNLPLFRGSAPGAGVGVAAFPVEAGPDAPPKSFNPQPTLRQAPTVGVRFDERAEDGSYNYSAGVHCNPRSTISAVREGRSDAVQLGGWVAQESSQFRVVAEGVLTPLRSALPLPANGVEGSAAPALGASLVPPRVAATLPALISSRLGFFWTPSRAGQLRSGYEVGFTLENDNAGRQELTASYFHHLVVRRNVHNVFEKPENRSINNYVDLGMELVYRNEGSTGAARTANALTPPSLRIGAAWQINKNSMVKVRVEDSSVSALFALKSWWDPSASAAFSVNHGLHNRQTTFGLSLSLENIGDVLFGKPDPEYRRKIVSQRENIVNQVEMDEDY